MPDLTTVPMQQCSQLDGGRTIRVAGSPHKVRGHLRRKTYTVTTGDEQHPWRCECPAYQFSEDSHCKYIARAQRAQCTWHQQTDGAPTQDNVCPRCGGSTTYVQVAV